MSSLLLYFLIAFFSIIVLTFLIRWIKEKHSKFRPIGALIISLLSAYSASFLFDMIIQWINGDLTLGNNIFPFFTWAGISSTLYFCAKILATKKMQVSLAFYILGIIAITAAFIGHFNNLYVGALLLLIGFSTRDIEIGD